MQVRVSSLLKMNKYRYLRLAQIQAQLVSLQDVNQTLEVSNTKLKRQLNLMGQEVFIMIIYLLNVIWF